MRRQSILCVDDEKIVLNSLKEQLKGRIGMDYNIEVAENGEDALAILDELHRDNVGVPLVISDYIMPGMKGDELLSRIHLKHPETMKILLTGQATLDGVTNIINRANLYRYIAKPWEMEDLFLAVTEAVKSYDKDRKIEEQNNALQQQNMELIAWTESFVETMGATLDTRDTTTAGHSKRMALYAVRTAEAINRVDYGCFKDASFSENEIKELYYAALLHDIGKIGVREQILLKEQRISLDRQMAIKYKLIWYRSYLWEKKRIQPLDADESKLLENLQDYLHLILTASSKEQLDEEEIRKIKEIARIKITDVDGNVKNLLDEFEVKNLTVPRGTLTEEERSVIRSHAEFTYNILKHIPWPAHLKNVPAIASSHHERLNGSGYYRGLRSEEISVPARILAILDVYEALTSPDRPYRKEKSKAEALAIIESEVRCGNLDKDIFEIIVKEKIYE